MVASRGIGITYGWHEPGLLDRVLPFIDYVEIAPDSLMQMNHGRIRFHEQTLQELQMLPRHVTLIVHGVGLSIASHNGYWKPYLESLDRLMEQLPIAWHSEHLAYTRVDDQFLGTMLSPPRTEEVLDLLCERIQRIQDRYNIPFLLEHPISLLPEPEQDYTLAGFLNVLTQRTGCGLIIDAYNLQCDARNAELPIDQFLDEVDYRAVREVHLANGVEHKGWWLDIHSKPTQPSTVALANEIIARAGGGIEVVIFELIREAVPALGHERIARELEYLRGELVGV